ncbi:MAG: hypothetical protein ACKKL5_00095 [Candidatus Komeilibacteria bacterium]
MKKNSTPKPLILDLRQPIEDIYKGGEKAMEGFTTHGTPNDPDSGGTD